jgi:hypothetical protein
LTPRRWVRSGITRQDRHATRNVNEDYVDVGHVDGLVGAADGNDVGPGHEIGRGDRQRVGAPSRRKPVRIWPRQIGSVTVYSNR